jgi:hypothetical protein
LRLDASAGLHRETMTDGSPDAALNVVQQREYHGGTLNDFETVPGCEQQTNANGTMFDPCPVGGNAGGYHTGGYGLHSSYTGNRWMADVKGTALLNKNEIKIGAHAELNTFDQTRYYSGPEGARYLVQQNPGYLGIWNFFSIPKGDYKSQLNDFDIGNYADPKMPYYKDALVANVKSVNTAYFIQDSIHPIQNLTVDLGLRYENQKMYDFYGDQFLNLWNLGPRLGLVFDPTNDGRSKIFASYGQFFETIPMNLAARYFGGEGIQIGAYDGSSCSPPPSQWTGTGTEWKSAGCTFYGPNIWNAGKPYPVQANLKGQHHNEIVAGLQHALTQDLVVGLNYTHRWLGAIVEDGFGPPSDQSVLANPGDVPQGAIDQVQRQIDAETLRQATLVDDVALQKSQAKINTLVGTKGSLTALKAAPKAKRTYDAITLTAAKRLAKNWFFQGSYTYSRLFGNYNGLYDADVNYFAPNGNNAYDTPDLMLNKSGPLANDRPHSGHVSALYQLPVGKGVATFGLTGSAFSGVPRNYVAALFPGQQLVFLLPRGSAGRTPTVTQLDLKFGYRRELSKTTAVEAFFDIFNVINTRETLLQDDNYTFEAAAAIVNGNVNDLKYAKNAAGAPITVNPNFGAATAYQQPIHGRMGLRFLF